MYVLIHTFLSLDKRGLLTQNLTVFNMYIALVKERMCVLSLVHVYVFHPSSKDQLKSSNIINTPTEETVSTALCWICNGTLSETAGKNERLQRKVISKRMDN